ncbi:two-component system response regulator CreB [Holophaga foetida]|uniref:two-component system response regulator CreB n=1 Tax=Holophaga foetida TaxID=35839 RepID=UPI00024742CE|nr:two-component system response regulator CreB [Holophaga foetida]
MSNDVLIVEDEPAIADTISYALETEGFITRRCTLGREALELLKEGGFRFVVLDVGLPDISGFEVLRRLRTFSDLPVLFLTARGEEVDRVVGLEIGADDYVSKPFSPRELAARVRGILRRTERGTPPAPPRFEVDENARRIRFQGQALELTRYEYQLLRLFLVHPERIWSRNELMERVWSGAEESTDRTVDTHVKTLRAKLRAVDPEADPIQTHRGQGYSLGKQS